MGCNVGLLVFFRCHILTGCRSGYGGGMSFGPCCVDLLFSFLVAITHPDAVQATEEVCIFCYQIFCFVSFRSELFVFTN